MARYDVCVIGLGAMGASAAWRLAARGASVIGFEQFKLGHKNGSSHGETRIIRSVYFEGEFYNDLVRAAYAAWADIERDHGKTFFRRTGGLDISVKPNGVYEAALGAAMAGGYDFEVLEGLALEERYPAFDIGGRARAVYAPDSGLLDSDEASDWMRAEAVRHSADLRDETTVHGWHRAADHFKIETSAGPFEARKLVVAAGAWAGQLLPQLASILIPERQVIAWYRAEGPHHADLPIFQLEDDDGERFYAFPPHKGAGLKFGLYHHRRERGVEHIDARGVDDEDLALLRTGLDLALPGVDRTPRRHAECRFTLAPDDRFLMGPMPEDKDLILLSPCSGHGYKFVPVIGEVTARMALEEDATLDVSAFSVERVL